MGYYSENFKILKGLYGYCRYVFRSLSISDGSRWWKELAELYSRFVKLSGFNCICFSDPEEALDEFSKSSIDYSLVIADLQMPCLDRLELAKRLRLYNKTVKIVLVTAILAEENLDDKKLKEVGIDGVYEKPFHLKDLRPIIKKILIA